MKKNRYIALLILFFIFSCGVFYFVFFSPYLNMQISTTKAYSSQVFYKKMKNGSYSENWSKRINLLAGTQKIKIKLPSYNLPIRLDIADAPYQIRIENIYLSIGLFNMPLQLTDEQYQIASVEKLDNIVSIKTLDNASDPQFFIGTNNSLIEIVRCSLSILFGIIVIVIVILGKQYYLSLKKYFNYVEEYSTKIYNYLNEIMNKYFVYFGIYFCIAIVFHLFEISNFLISIDDEYSAFRTRPEAWIWDGRWTAYLIERFIFDQPTMPFIPNICVCLLMTLSYLIILRTHKIEHNWKTFILFPIYVAFPTLWFINEFYGNMVIVAFGFFIISLSLFILMLALREFPQYNLKKLLIASSFLSIAIGSYQSFIMLAIVLSFSIFILQHFKSSLIFFRKRYQIYYFVNITIFLIFSFLQYLLIAKLFKLVFPSDYDYVGGFLRLQNIDYQLVVQGLLSATTSIYSGALSIFGVSLSSLGYILLVFFSVVIFRQKKYILFSVILLILMLISPFLLNFFTGGNQLPTRAFVSIPYIIWFASFIILIHKKKIINLIGLIMICGLYIQMFSALGQYAAATQIGQIHDRTLAADLYKRIADVNPNFDKSQISFIDIYGYKKVETVYPYVETSTINASFFDWDGGNISRMLSYMKLLGYNNLRAVDKEKMLANTEFFQKMPSWPNKNSVQFINGIYLIKLSENADVNHKENKK